MSRKDILAIMEVTSKPTGLNLRKTTKSFYPEPGGSRSAMGSHDRQVRCRSSAYERLRLKVQTYLENVFELLPHCETLEDYQELLPWTWRQ